jgi:hypothetical protein
MTIDEHARGPMSSTHDGDHARASDGVHRDHVPRGCLQLVLLIDGHRKFFFGGPHFDIGPVRKIEPYMTLFLVIAADTRFFIISDNISKQLCC